MTLRIILLLAVPASCLSAARFHRTAGGDIVLEDSRLSLRFDSRLRAQAAFRSPAGRWMDATESRAAAGAIPPQYLKANGIVSTDFAIDEKSFHSLSEIRTVHGPGKRLRLWGVSGSLKKTITIEIYDKYPGTAIFRTSYTNLGSAPLTIETVFETMWRLKRDGLWALHPRRWIWGEDFLFPVEAGTSLSGSTLVYRKEKAGPKSIGGGLPAVSYLTPGFSLTLGYLSPKQTIVRFPLHDENGVVTVGLERDIGLGPERAALPALETFESLPTFLSLHSGDFHDGIRTMSLLLQDQGVKYNDPPMENLTAPTWSNRGNGDKWSKQSILDMLPVLKKYGIKWIHLGGRWENNLGDYEPSSYFNGVDDLKKFIAFLHSEGFRVTVFMSDFVVDPASRVFKEQPGLFIKDKDGNILTTIGFNKPDAMLCPSYPPAREFMRRVCVKLARDYGFDGVKNDGNSMPQPCYDPSHKHPYPEQSVEDYYLLNKVVYETFAELKPASFVNAFCFDGTYPYFGHLLHTSRPWPNADQNSEWQIRLKQKIFKAVLGPRRVLLNDHSDAKYLTGRRGDWRLGPISGLAMGSVMETVVNRDYDHSPESLDRIFEVYHREKLPEGGEYLNLYNMVHDQPEGHAVRKNGSVYYGFFAKRFEGNLELRGLADGVRYRVVDYLRGTSYPAVTAQSGKAILQEVEFSGYLLLKVERN